MKKIIIITIFIALAVAAPVQRAHAQIAVAEIIKQGIKRVIRAVDLQIQRLQNGTIKLQNVQKTVENAMSKLKLTEITDWVQKQKELYGEYFNELAEVKNTISYYSRVSAVLQKQVRLVQSYQQAYSLFKQDSHFTAREIAYMYKVYSGILDESLQNLDRVYVVISPLKLTMSDGRRLEIINDAADSLDGNYSDLQSFNTQNKMLSLNRAKDANDAQAVRQLYGLE